MKAGLTIALSFATLAAVGCVGEKDYNPEACASALRAYSDAVNRLDDTSYDKGFYNAKALTLWGDNERFDELNDAVDSLIAREGQGEKVRRELDYAVNERITHCGPAL